MLIVDDNPRKLDLSSPAFSAHGGIEVAGEMKP